MKTIELAKPTLPLLAEKTPRPKTKLYCANCLEVLRNMPDNSIDLIITSPPYADQRTATYGGINPDKYVEWFMPIAKELLRVLKKDGTFILNIKEKVVNGERHTYVLRTYTRNAKNRLAVDRRICLEQEKLLPGKMAKPFSRCLGTAFTIQ